MSETVGVIGLGPMGGTIASLLLEKGFNVIGRDIDAKRVEVLVGQGMVAADSPKDIGEQTDIIITSLPYPEVLMEIVNGNDGLLQNDKSGQIIIECSTLTVKDKLKAHDDLKAKGKIFLDCPISATPAMLGKMMGSIYISGDEAAYKKTRSVFEGFTKTNFYVGEVGNGSKMKFLANYLVHVHICSAAECMVLGQQAGLEPDLIHSVLKESAGSSKMFEIRGAMMAKSDYREGGGTMFAVYEKDASIINEFAASVKSPIDLYATARQRFNSALALGLDHLDTSAVCAAVEQAVGIKRDLVE